MEFDGDVAVKALEWESRCGRAVSFSLSPSVCVFVYAEGKIRTGA